MKIRILACAEQEFSEVVDYYNGQGPALGYEFAAEVKLTLGRIVTHPNAWPLLSRRARRCILNKFPYSIIYQVRQDYILILAIMHMKQDPKHWQERLIEV